MSHINSEIETLSDLKSLSMQFPLLLVHRITSTDLNIQSTQKQPLSIAWYGAPFTHNNEQYIRTLKTFPQKVLTTEPLKEQMRRYPDLHQKIIQKNNQILIQNSDVAKLAQWFQCFKCQKWRVNHIEKKYFPQLLQPQNWQCNMGALSVNNCNIQQTQPTEHEFSELDLNALQLQRELRAQDSTDWYKMAHAMLDGMIRKFDTYLLPFIHPIFCPNYYKSNVNAMHLTQLKYLLENQKITDITTFINELIKMWENAMAYYAQSDPIYHRAVFLHRYCVDVIAKLEIPQQAKLMILSQIQIRFSQHQHTNHKHEANANGEPLPLIRITTQHQELINQPLPPLEKESVVINISDSDENMDANTMEVDALSISIDGNDENNNNDKDNTLDPVANTAHNIQQDMDDAHNAMDELTQLLTDNNASTMDVDDISHQQTTTSSVAYRNLCNSYTDNRSSQLQPEKASSLQLGSQPQAVSTSNSKSTAPAPAACLDVAEEKKEIPQASKYRISKKVITASLRKLNLRICAKPADILCADKFENVLVSVAGIADKIKDIINQIRTFDAEECFFKVVQLAEYTQIVSNPIHFGQIIAKLEEGKYQIISDVLSDFTLLWSNCYIFNGEPDPNNDQLSGFSNFAMELQHALEEYIKQFRDQLASKGYFANNDLYKIGKICDKLGLGTITTNKIYYFQTKMEMYKNIESHFDSFNVEQFKEFLCGKNSNYCRDMKNGMNVKGPIIPTKVLRKTIIERFAQLKGGNINGTTVAAPIERRRSHKRQVLKVRAISVETSESTSPLNLSKSSTATTSSRKKRSYVISDSDTDQETETDDQISINRPNCKRTDETKEVMTQLHEYPMKGPFTAHNGQIWCCDNAQCRSRPTHLIKYWLSTHLGENFYLCDGCVAATTFPLTLGKIRYFTDKDGDKIRLGLDCPYIACNAPLQLFYGIHNNCLAHKIMIRCNHCKSIISNTNLLYYHCIDGCLNYKSIHGHQYYLCAICADKYCYSPQKYAPKKKNMLAFYGVWTWFDRLSEDNECEIMIMLQDSNRISLQLCGSNDRFDGSIQEINDKILIEIDNDDKKMNSMHFKHAIWKYYSDIDIRLEFVNESNTNKIFHKVSPKCNNCKCDMLFLYQNIFPNNSYCQNGLKCCDNFEKYDYMKYSTLKAINYGIFHDNISKNKFYFFCMQCNKYSICAGCSLIKHEIQTNKTNIIRKKKDNNHNNNDKMSENIEMKILRDKIRAIETDRDFWKEKHKILSKAMQNTLNSMNK